jgi:hypothetical protein
MARPPPFYWQTDNNPEILNVLYNLPSCTTPDVFKFATVSTGNGSSRASTWVTLMQCLVSASSTPLHPTPSRRRSQSVHKRYVQPASCNRLHESLIKDEAGILDGLFRRVYRLDARQHNGSTASSFKKMVFQSCKFVVSCIKRNKDFCYTRAMRQ